MGSLTDLFADISDELHEELIQMLLNTPVLRIERIVSLGGKSPECFWYDQDPHEWALLVKRAPG